MQQEQHRAVADGGGAGAEPAVEAELGVLVVDVGSLVFPVDAEGRVGQAVVELLVVEGVFGEGVAEGDVVDVLALDDHVGLADRVRGVVVVLPVQAQLDARVQRTEVLVGDGQHAAGAGSGVVDRPHHSRLREGVVVEREQQLDHELDDFARGVVVARRLVGLLVREPDQLLEHQAHLDVADRARMEVGLRELLGHCEQLVLLGQFVERLVELEALEDVPHVGGEPRQVRTEVRAKILRVGDELGEVERGGVVELVPGRLLELDRLHQLGERPDALRGLEHGRLRVGEDCVQAAEHRERQDDGPILGGLERAAEGLRDVPDEGDVIHHRWALLL